MTTLTSTFNAIDLAPAPVAKPKAGLRRNRDLILYLVLTVLVLGAWQFSRMGFFKPGDDIGYWLGVAGGVMMLLLFSYPLRKYFKFMHRLGKVKWWFIVHMVLGIGGPLLILLHSTFHLGSVNAAVALFSMLVVAGSGVIGRFLYLRIHRGLQGEQNNLAELQRRAGLAEGEMKSRFSYAPDVAAKLLQFEADAFREGRGSAVLLRRVFVLPIKHQWLRRECSNELVQRLRKLAKEERWSRRQYQREKERALSLTRYYMQSVVRVAQFTAYVRLFALWHVAHVPFVYVLLATAIFHVFAVHAY